MRSDEYVILDNQLRRIGLLSNRVRAGTPFWGDTIDQSIADDDSSFAWEDLKDTFNTLNLAANKKSYDHQITGITIPSNAPDAQHITAGNHLLYYDSENKRYYVMRIINVDETAKDNEFQFSFDASNLAEWKLSRTIPAAFSSDAVDAQTVFTNLLAKSGWRLEFNSKSNITLKEDFDGTSSAQSYLQQLAADYNVELDCYVELNGVGEVVGQVVEVSDHLGSESVKRLDYRHDLTGVERKLVDDALVSKLYVLGNDGATIEEANNGVAFITDPNANAKYNHDIKGSGSTWLEGTITSDSIQNSSGLLAWGKKQLAMYNHPRYNYTVSIRSDIAGGIGDDFRIADFALNPPLLVDARVIKVTKSLSDPSVHSLTLGEYSTITPRKISPDSDSTADIDKLRQEMQQADNQLKESVETAQTDASHAQSDAALAKTTASSAQDAADKADKNATTANNHATAAQQTADTADTNAKAAQSTANTANTTAISASTKADEAKASALTAANDVDEVKRTYFADNVYFQTDEPTGADEGAVWFKTTDNANWLNYHNDDNSSAPDPSQETHTEVITVQVPNDGVDVAASGSFTWHSVQPISTSPSLAARVSAYTYNGLSATYRGKTIADGILWVYYTNYNGSTSYVPIKDLKSNKRYGTDSNAASDPEPYHTEEKTITVGGNTQQVTHTETIDRVGVEFDASGKFYKTSGATGVYTAPHAANKAYNYSATVGNPIYYSAKVYSESWLWIKLGAGAYAPAYKWNGSDDLTGLTALGIDTNESSNLPSKETKEVTETVTVPDTSADNDTQLQIDTANVDSVSQYQGGKWVEIPYQKQVVGASLMGASIDSPLISLGNDGALWSSYSYSQLPTWFKPIQAIGTIAMAKGELVVTGQTKHYENSQWGYYDTDQNFSVADDTNYTTTIINAGGIKNEVQTSDRQHLVSRSFLDGNGLSLTDGQRNNVTNNISNKQFLSKTVYNTTTGDGANVNISPNGVIQRSTSATKYKLDITDYDEALKQGYKLIHEINPKMWFDKGQIEDYSKALTDNQQPNPDDNLNRIHGLIAEDLEHAGLEEFITRGADGEIEGIDYTKLWTLLIPVCKDLDSRLTKLENQAKPE